MRFALLSPFALVVASLNAAGQSLPNERFATQIGDIAPVQWRVFEPIRKNFEACMADGKLTTPVCTAVRDRLQLMYFDALGQALVFSKLAKPGEPRFCDKYAESLITEKKNAEAITYAVLLIEERMKYGSGLYGEALPNTYLGKIAFDALHETKPCK